MEDAKLVRARHLPSQGSSRSNLGHVRGHDFPALQRHGCHAIQVPRHRDDPLSVREEPPGDPTGGVAASEDQNERQVQAPTGDDPGGLGLAADGPPRPVIGHPIPFPRNSTRPQLRRGRR